MKPTSKAVQRIRHYSKLFDLDDKQTLYLIYSYYGQTYPITSKHLKSLISHNILDKNANFVENIGKLKIKNLKENNLIIDKPIFENAISEKVYEYIISKLAYKDIDSKRPLSINLEHYIVKSRKTMSKDYLTRVDSLMGKDDKYGNLYTTLLCLFPTSSIEHNARWVAFFKAPYDGVNLRIKSSGTARKLKTILKREDIDAGVLLYAVFLAITNGVTSSGTYIISQSRFYDEVDEWYMQAKGKLLSADNVEMLFKKDKKKDFKGGMQL